MRYCTVVKLNELTMKMTAELVKVMSQGHAQDGDEYGERGVHVVRSGS